VVAPGPGAGPDPDPDPVVVPVVLWLLVDALVVFALLFIAEVAMVEPRPGESVGEGSWVLAERVMPVAVPVPLRFGGFCILGRIYLGPDCIFEADKSRRLRLGVPDQTRPDRTTRYILKVVTLVVISLNCKNSSKKFSQDHS
jgi:hypothetical protein